METFQWKCRGETSLTLVGLYRGKDADAPSLGSHSPSCHYPVWASDVVLSVLAARVMNGNTHLVAESGAGLVPLTSTP